MDNNSIQHHGVLGMHWGVRRYQNKDGSWTKAGKKHKLENFKLTDKQKKAIKIGAAVVGTALAAYGGYKLNQFIGKQNTFYAEHVGSSLGNKFGNDLLSSVHHRGNRSTDYGRYLDGRSYSIEAGGAISPLISEKVFGKTPTEKISNTINAINFKRGKKTPLEVVNYNRIIGEILKENKVLTEWSDTELYYKINSALGCGAEIPPEIMKYTK